MRSTRAETRQIFARKIARLPATAAFPVAFGILALLTPLAARAQDRGEQAPAPKLPASELSLEQFSGSIAGDVFDPSGAAVAGARAKLVRPDSTANQETSAGDDGRFFFGNIAPGPFQIIVDAEGFAPQSLSGVLHSGESYNAPRIALALAAETTQMQVSVPTVEIAEEEIREEEKQRVLGVMPNFYVTYVPNAAPLTTKQKFKLAVRMSVDPVTFLLTGAVAGVQQADNVFRQYGQGAQGYGKRFGANYADTVTSTFIGSAILPSILKQDPRYFYKGSGTIHSRILYAMEMAVICKGDNGRWQPNYSAILGSLAAGGISNFYYPSQDREGAELTFENAAIGIGTTVAANILQEFVIRKLTPGARNHDPAKSSDPSTGNATQ